MTKDIVYRLVVDDEGAIKKVEQFGKETEKADREFAKTKKSAKDAETGVKGLGSAFGGLKSMVGLASGALAGLGLVSGLKDVMSTTSELAEETEKFHAATGMGAQKSLAYVAALKARGVGSEAVVKGYKALGKAVQTAERQQYTFAVGQEKAHAQGRLFTGLIGQQAEAFQQLGINLSQVRSTSPEALFVKITGKLENMKAGLAKTTLASQLFGRAGTALLPVLEKNSLSLNHFRYEAERFFPTLRGEGVKTLEQLQEKQAESKLAWEGLEFTLGMKLAPVMSSAMALFSRLIAEMDKGKGPLATVQKAFEGIARFAGGAFSFIKEISKDLGIKLTPGTLGAVLGGAAAVKGAHRVAKPTVKIAKAFKSIGKYSSEHPYLLPATAALLAGGYAGLKLNEAFPEGFAGSPEGQLKELRRVLGGQLRAIPGLGHTELGGHPAAQTAAGQHLRELIAIRNAVLSLREHGQSARQIIGELNMNGRKIGEVLALDPQAMRFLSEGIERHGLSRKARG